MTKRILTVLLASLLIAVSIIGVSASAPSGANADFSIPGSSGNVTMTSTEILEQYLGESLGMSEREFFESIADGRIDTLEIAYSEIINTNKAQIEYENGSLNIRARKYEYTGVNGKSFVWIPDKAYVKDTAVTLENDGDVYVGKIVSPEPISDDIVKISYKAEISISASDMNEILNLYRNSAEYALDKANYDAYLVEKKLYDDAKAKYEKYLADMEEYYKLLYAYNNYENETLVKYYEDIKKYQAYEVDKKEYEAKMEKYNAYMAEYSKIQKQLEGLDLIDVPMTMGRTIYAAVMGGTVDQVLENEDAIVFAGADRKAVQLASVATERVRSLMKGYKACKTELEKYMYYTANYENLCESFLLLTQTLDALYTNDVRTFLVMKDKNEKYVILIAQLALVTNALIDGPVYNYYGKVSYTSSWKFDGKTISRILENKTYFVDTDTATPIDVPAPVEKPADLVEVKKPVYPLEPEKPIMPTPVSDPGSAPQSVKNPETAPKQSVLPEIYKALGEEKRLELARAFSGGTVPSERSNLITSFGVSVNTSISKVYNAEIVKVSFKMPDGSYEVIDVDKNSPVVCEAAVPYSYVDDNGDTWILKGWRRQNNIRSQLPASEVDMSQGFDTDTVLEPIYEHCYNVKWIINENEYSSSVSALVDAVCPVIPNRADDGNSYYEFVGWADESGQNVGMNVGKPTRDVTYTAVFEKRFIVPLTSTVGASVTYEDGLVICDAVRHHSSLDINISELIERAVSNRSGLLIKLNAGTLKFAFSEVLELEKIQIDSIGIEYSGGARTQDNYIIRAKDKSGNPVCMAVDVTVKIRALNTERYKLFERPENSESSYVKHSLAGKELSFEAQTETLYSFKPEYAVRVVPNELVDIVVSNTLPERIEEIFCSVTPKEGVEILEILIEDSDGKALDVTGDIYKDGASFWVNEKDVTVSVMARYKTYTVVFRANGKNIYQLEALHGTAVSAPAAPKIGDDGVYIYKFVGWNSEITPVTCDIIYEAVYEKTLIPLKEDKGGLKLSPEVKKLLYVAIAAFVIFITFISLLTVLIVKKLRKRKARRNGFATYAEYKAKKKMLRLEKKRDSLSCMLSTDTGKGAKITVKLDKNAKKLQKANDKFTKATDKRKDKEERIASKKRVKSEKRKNKKNSDKSADKAENAKDN